MQTRRDILKTLAAVPVASALPGRVLAKTIDSKFHGVMIGAQSYSFRDRPLDAAIQGYIDVGLGYAELWQGHLEPKDRAEVKAWRTSAPESFFKDVRAKFDKAGIVLYAFNYSFRDNYTDEEIEYGFKMAQWLGVNKITASSNVSTAKRISPYADKYKVFVGFHNHGNIHPNEFATPDDFAKALEAGSKYLAINLDIGHATAAGWDPVDYLAKNHQRIVTLHLKDRGPNQDGKEGVNMPFGQGSTNIKGTLQLLEKNHYPIPAMIEYEYKGGDTVEEMKKCLAYCKAALA
jgi:sugar phosphate isomerase/epimerase